MSDELLPCPFCGNDGIGPIETALHVSHTQNDWHPAYDCYCVQCDKCTATMGCSATEDEAISAWNTRTPRPAATDEATVERLLNGLKHEFILRPGTEATARAMILAALRQPAEAAKP